MATIKDPFSGETIETQPTDGRKPSWDPDAPQPDEVASLVALNDLDAVKEAFGNYALSTTNLLHDASSGDMVDFLVSQGADVNQPHQPPERDDSEDEPENEPFVHTPLQVAAVYGRKEVFDRLLAYDADIEIGGDKRPLMLALGPHLAYEPYVDMANELLDRGARVDAKPFEKPVLLQAVQNNHQAPIVKRLLEAGADPTQGFENEGTALHNVRNHQADVVDQLLDHGAKINAPVSDEDPTTPLEAVVHRGAPKAVERLIERGADAEQVTQSPRWPVMMQSQRASVRAAVGIVESTTLSRAAEQTQEQPEDEVAPRRQRARL